MMLLWVVEQIHRTHEEFPDRPSNQLVHQAIKYLLPSMIGSSISTIVIFVPFMLLVAWQVHISMFLQNTMIITLVCSFFVTWIRTTGNLSLVFQFKITLPWKEEAWCQNDKKRNWVSFFLRRPVLSILFILFLLLSIIYILPHLETGFLPEMDERDQLFSITKAPPGNIARRDRQDTYGGWENNCKDTWGCNLFKEDRCPDGILYNRT